MSMSVEIRFREVEKIVAASQGKGLDPEIAAKYCKLGCVMVCGAVERSIEILVTERLGNKAPQIKSFFKSFFKRGTNYDCDSISELLYKFDKDWGRKFSKFVSDNEQIKSGISSCYAIRNSIAHGGTNSLGPSTLKQYFDSAFNLIVELEYILKS